MSKGCFCGLHGPRRRSQSFFDRLGMISRSKCNCPGPRRFHTSESVLSGFPGALKFRKEVPLRILTEPGRSNGLGRTIILPPMLRTRVA